MFRTQKPGWSDYQKIRRHCYVSSFPFMSKSPRDSGNLSQIFEKRITVSSERVAPKGVTVNLEPILRPEVDLRTLTVRTEI